MATALEETAYPIKLFIALLYNSSKVKSSTCSRPAMHFSWKDKDLASSINCSISLEGSEPFSFLE